MSDIIRKQYHIGTNKTSGYHGCVYQAWRLEDGKAVAIKCLKKSKMVWCSEKCCRENPTPREVCNLRKCQGLKNVIQIIDAVKDEQGRWAIIMDRPENSLDLDQFLASRDFKPLTEHAASKILSDVINGLSQMSCVDLGYLDLKMENVLIDPEVGKAWLIDVAFCVDPTYDGDVQRLHHFCGTHIYKPPEQLLGMGYTWEGNTVWTIGHLLYEMLHGNSAFDDDMDIVTTPLSISDKLSAEARDLLQSCLEKDEDKRATLYDVHCHEWWFM